MKSLFFNKKGPAAKVLQYGDTGIGDLLPGEIRLKMLASPIHPADFMFIEKTYRVTPQYPQVAGFEGAGRIVDNGGDHHYPLNALVAFRYKNAWAGYVNIPKSKVILLPAHMPIEKAAQLALNPITAWALLADVAARPGEWIILSAANSALGKLIIQFAKSRHIKAMAIVRESSRQQSLLSLGATAVLQANDGDLQTQVKTLAGNEKIAGFLDAVGGDLASSIIQVISANSKIIHYGLFSDKPVMYHNADVIFKNLVITGFGIDAWLQNKTEGEREKIWSEMISTVIDPGFKMDVAAKFSLPDFQKAMATGKPADEGKLLFWMHE